MRHSEGPVPGLLHSFLRVTGPSFFGMAPVLFVARFPSPRLVNKISKNRQFASGAGPLKSVGLVAVAGLVDAVNYYHPARRFFYNGGGI